MNEALRRYFELVQAQPEAFVNPPGAAFAIILDEREIARAEAEQAQRLIARGQPAEWATVGVTYEDQYLCLLRDAVRYLDGSLGSYIRALGGVNQPSGVAILPVYQGRILLIRHFRHATRAWHLEIPAGGCAPAGSLDDDARRELAEEIGGVATRLISLGMLHGDVGIGANALQIYYAELSAYGETETLEGISEILPVTPAQFEALIRAGQLTTHLPLAGFTYARAHGLL